MHAVGTTESENPPPYKHRTSLCGVRPGHGWSLDLFIEEPCTRCQAAMAKRKAAGEVFSDLAEIAKAKRDAEHRREVELLEARTA